MKVTELELDLIFSWCVVRSEFEWLSTHAQRRQWHPSPVLLRGKSHEQRSLVGCSPWGREESNDWGTSLSLFTFMHWRRKWQPTPVFLPGESQGWGSLVGCRLWGRTGRTRSKWLSSRSSNCCRFHTYRSFPYSNSALRLSNKSQRVFNDNTPEQGSKKIKLCN